MVSWLPSPRVSSMGCRAQAALSSHGEDGRLGQDLTTHPGSLLGADTAQDKFTCDSPSRGSLLASVSTIMGTKEWAVYPHPHPLNYAVYLHSPVASPWGAQAGFAGGRGKAWLEIPLLLTPLC